MDMPGKTEEQRPLEFMKQGKKQPLSFSAGKGNKPFSTICWK